MSKTDEEKLDDGISMVCGAALAFTGSPDQRCDTCRFWDGNLIGYLNEVGHCRRHAPVVAASDEESFPLTTEDCWCGDWQPKEGTAT